MSTALQMVNRVMRLLRNEDVGSFASPTGLTEAILDRVNDAMLTVLNDRNWDFMTRHDGVMTFRGSQSLIGGTLFTNASRVIDTSFDATAPPWLEPLVWRIVATNDGTYSQTSHRVTAWNVVVLGSGISTLDSGWLGTTGVRDTLGFAYEYILPSTVRTVLSARHEEQEMRLVFVDKNIEYDSVFPRPWDVRDDNPDMLIIGGSGIGTLNANGNPDALVTSTVFGTIARIHPVPSADLRIDYSYVLQPGRFTAITDEYTYIPEKVNDLIVDLAYARCQQVGIGNEPGAGIALEARVQASIRQTWGTHRPNAGQRRILRSLDAKGGPNLLYAGLPRVVGSL